MGKEKISITLSESQVREISDLQEEYESRSETIRALVDKGLAYDDVEDERDELRDELRSLDGMDDVVGYARRRQLLADVPIWRRIRWRITGVPDETRDQ